MHAVAAESVSEASVNNILLIGAGDTLLGISAGAAQGSLLMLLGLTRSTFPEVDPHGSLVCLGGEELNVNGDAREGGTPTAPMPPHGSGIVDVVIPSQGSPPPALEPTHSIMRLHRSQYD